LLPTNPDAPEMNIFIGQKYMLNVYLNAKNWKKIQRKEFKAYKISKKAINIFTSL
jgi:hypothetical protein